MKKKNMGILCAAVVGTVAVVGINFLVKKVVDKKLKGIKLDIIQDEDIINEENIEDENKVQIPVEDVIVEEKIKDEDVEKTEDKPLNDVNSEE